MYNAPRVSMTTSSLNRIIRRFSFTTLFIFSLFLKNLVLAADENIILLATTTSTDNSGLLDYLLPYVEQDIGYEIRVVTVGTGKALRLGQSGDVDALLVHAQLAEMGFMKSGYGADRKQVMFNDFVLVGPEQDPANIALEESLNDTLIRIDSELVLFISRGDDSGTHKKELNLWNSVEIVPDQKWYREVGQGMGKTLQIANELGAYTLIDRGTWIFAKDNLRMKVVFEGDARLNNQYSIIVVNPGLINTNYLGATALSDWLVSEKGQKLINSYKINGKQLFYGNADQK